MGQKENGIVAITAYGFVDGMILPLTFEVSKPRERLKSNDDYQSKPQIAARMLRQLQAMGFVFALVLADSLDGESKVNFVNVLDALNLPYMLAIRSNRLKLPTTAAKTPVMPGQRPLFTKQDYQKHLCQ